MNTAQDAREALTLYARLDEIDAYIKALTEPAPHTSPPLQAVSFYQRTTCYSGTQSYKPTHNAKAIVRAILKDMNTERDGIVCELHNMGFGI